MLLSTRDAQRERRASQIFASTSVAERLNLAGIDNVSFRADAESDLHGSPMLSRREAQSHIQTPSSGAAIDVSAGEETTNNVEQVIPSQKKKYQWRMTHYFYIHVCFFILNGLFGGLIVWLIENHSSSKNVEMTVNYIDAWFVSSSCVYSCGLTTIDFAKLSRASQVILMVFTFISGVTISTLPALIVKARTHKKVEGITVDDDHYDVEEDNNDELPTFDIRRERNLPKETRNRLATLPTVSQLRYRAYITCIFLILGTCFTIYIIIFIAIGSWLTAQYTPDQLLQGNSTVNPWYVSFIITITGFNQNGLTPFSDGFGRFIHDVYLNLFVMILVMSGTSLFPFILRNVVLLVRVLSPWRHKVVFDYILMNNHRLSTLLFPALQTRIYLMVTILLYILGVSISLILDLNSENLAKYPPGTRFLIFLFHTVNSRFAGFQSFDISLFATATLLVYLLLMATKPQMLCALDESPLELSWLALQAKEEANAETKSIENGNSSSGIQTRNSRVGSITSLPANAGLPIRQMHRFLRRQSLVTKSLARQHFARAASSDDENYKPPRLRYLRIRLFLIYFARSIIKHTFSFVVLTRTWLFFFIFLICAFEYRRMAPVDPNITVFKIIFEIISAFGAVGLTLGYPNIASSFASVLSPASKTILVITMLMGRHRGLLASMKDQEAIEHSAADVLARRREEVINTYQRTISNTNVLHETRPPLLTTYF
ncbi:unnamed protein product [Rotaria magnacalcarata]|uniref:Uncharacterized protein n=1 Tax=Rotaria magnacalcarata TaxID=392030 RepID=A0A816BJY2_9BILA|nr:unnamed protein product [Rotaria magnacalcarata]CAF1610269.1 unnamed protein product [Rotaria magnacalcarata]CAF2113741.1 unnamed protein product [Rotaria magnacalcarata]CAF3928111.1 unnamed protein product [Rotaria magnacalcarata]CAF4044225.1 unnamed protein product [Rotaria magnacalcarata]